MKTCYDCIHCEACSDAGDSGFSALKEDVNTCKHFKGKADFVEVVRCKDCVFHEEGCPLDTHPYMTADDGYCYKGKRSDT